MAYTHLNVVDGKIESGWDFREDAKEHAAVLLKDCGLKTKILTREGCNRVGLNPRVNSKDWHTQKSLEALIKNSVHKNPKKELKDEVERVFTKPYWTTARRDYPNGVYIIEVQPRLPSFPDMIRFHSLYSTIEMVGGGNKVKATLSGLNLRYDVEQCLDSLLNKIKSEVMDNTKEQLQSNPRRGMTLTEFIKEYKKEIDDAIHRVSDVRLNDRERRLWILNDEGLYRWAKSCGVKI